MWNTIMKYKALFTTDLLAMNDVQKKKTTPQPEEEGDTHYHLHFHLPDLGLGW